MYSADILCWQKSQHLAFILPSWSLHCLVGDTDVNQIIPLEDGKWQLRFVELVRKVMEAFVEEGRFEMKAEGSTQVP